MSLTLYRQCKLGQSLSQAITDMLGEKQITANLAECVLRMFDKVLTS